MTRKDALTIACSDAELFKRCRVLNLDIAQILRTRLTDKQASVLRLLLQKPELPPGARRRIERTLVSHERDGKRLKALQSELDQLAAEAETAAEHVRNPRLRRFVKLFALDGLTQGEAAAGADVCARTAGRYVHLLACSAEAGSTEGRTDGRADLCGAARR